MARDLSCPSGRKAYKTKRDAQRMHPCDPVQRCERCRWWHAQGPHAAWGRDTQVIEAADEILGGAACVAGGYWMGVKHSVRQLPAWSSMRLVKLTGERPDNYVETRDTGRSSLPARLWFGRDFRYVVRRYVNAEVVEDVRYRHVDEALKAHDESKP